MASPFDGVIQAFDLRDSHAFDSCNLSKLESVENVTSFGSPTRGQVGGVPSEERLQLIR